MLRKSYTFIYLPDDSVETRKVSVSRIALLGSAVCLCVLVAVASLYVIGICQGTGWLPGGSESQRRADALAAHAELMDQKVAMLRSDLEESFSLQEQVAIAVGIEPLGADVREAGVGGRRPPEGTPDLIPAEDTVLASARIDLDKMLRQARIQRQGYMALLDTLAEREDVLAHVPSIRPVDIGWLSSRYGKRHDPFTGKMAFHRGLDFSVPAGSPVRATADGVIRSVKNDRGLVRVITIDHGNRLTTRYAHLSQWLVKQGDRVRRGDIIAKSGSSGRSTAPHLHYEISADGRHTDPLPFMLDSYATR